MNTNDTTNRAPTGTPDEPGERIGALGNHRFGMAIGAVFGLGTGALFGGQLYGLGGAFGGAVLGAAIGAWAGWYGAKALRPMAGEVGGFRVPPEVGSSRSVPTFRKES